MRQRIIGVSACFDYMRVADTIDSQKSEDRDITEITVNSAKDKHSAANILLSRT
jgi:hypothetical protein